MIIYSLRSIAVSSPLIRQMLEKGVNAPFTSSAGRLFDAVAGLIGLRLRASFEGQAAMELEFAAHERVDDKYSFTLQEESPLVIDWQPAILEIIDDLRAGETRGMISAKFHNMLCRNDRSGSAKNRARQSGLKRRLLPKSLAHRAHNRSAHRRKLPSLLASTNPAK